MFIHKFRARFPTHGVLETNNAYLDWIEEIDADSTLTARNCYATIDDYTLVSLFDFSYKDGDTDTSKTVTLNNLQGKTSEFLAEVNSFGSSLSGTEFSINNDVSYSLYSLAPRDFIKIENAQSFTDEENPTIIYRINSNYKYYTHYSTRIGILRPGLNPNEICNIDDFLIYRELNFEKGISSTTQSYTFEFTDRERELLRNTYTNSAVNSVYFALLSEAYISTNSKDYNYKRYLNKNSGWVTDKGLNTAYSCIEKTLTFVGAEPTLNPTVRDIKSETLALTGNENIIVKYESMAEYSSNAVASKNAVIIEESVTCGSITKYNTPNGIFLDAESENFLFTAIDSRGLQTATLVSKTAVNYVKPTCYQEFEIKLSSKTTAEIKVKLSGNYYHGSFGLVDNTLLLEMRYGKKGETLSEWMPITAAPEFYDNQYDLTVVLDGFNYEDSYVFQSRITDKLNLVQSSQDTVKLYPVFDWSDIDFNFNVPIHMNGETVLRHNAEANNIVLSASGGHIYLRPKGTDESEGETIIYPDGSIKFGGAVDFSDSVTIDGNLFKDHIIETGTEAMGSNGTWYWCKWASGKSECWGCRNFGNMAVTTAWGNLYRSAILTQDLPNKVFVTTPDVININIVNSNYGGWICKHENAAPSAVTTGSFIFVRPASATVSPTYIGFHVIGLWKQ